MQLWLTLGLGIDTAGYAPTQVSLGLDLVPRDVPLRAGMFVSLGIAEDGQGLDQERSLSSAHAVARVVVRL